MASPELVNVTINEINRVAQNIDGGIVHALDTHDITYLQTYRNTGEAAPTDDSEFVPLSFVTFDYVEADDYVDVYIIPYSLNRTGQVQMRIDAGV